MSPSCTPSRRPLFFSPPDSSSLPAAVRLPSQLTFPSPAPSSQRSSLLLSPRLFFSPGRRSSSQPASHPESRPLHCEPSPIVPSAIRPSSLVSLCVFPALPSLAPSSDQPVASHRPIGHHLLAQPSFASHEPCPSQPWSHRPSSIQPPASHRWISRRRLLLLSLLLLSRRIQPPPIAFFSVCLSLLRPPSPSFFSVSIDLRPSSLVLPTFSAFFPARTYAPAQTLRRDGQTLLPDLLPCPDDQILFDTLLPCPNLLPSLPCPDLLWPVEDEYHEVGQGGKVSVSEKVVKDETNETDVVAPKQRSEYKISKNGKEDDKQEFRAAFDKLCEKDSLLAMEGPPTTLFNESKGVEATEIVTNELHKMFKIYESHSTPRKASNVVGECNEGKTDRANAFYVKDEIGFGDCLEQNGAEWCNLG
ncbi:hypothetical protein ACLOJK_041922 [Asimina triloba]